MRPPPERPLSERGWVALAAAFLPFRLSRQARQPGVTAAVPRVTDIAKPSLVGVDCAEPTCIILRARLRPFGSHLALKLPLQPARRANGDNPKARWLERTDERLVAAFDAYDAAVG